MLDVRRALLALAVLIPAWTHAATLTGRVQSGATPLASRGVALYATDPQHPGRCATVLGAATTAADGTFAIGYEPPAVEGAVVYAVADGGSVKTSGKFPRDGKCKAFKGPVVLASVLGVTGTASVPGDVVLNPPTTVATAYALAQFTSGAKIAGKAPGIQNAAGMAWNLMDPATGNVGTVLATSPNGDETETLGSFNALANMVAACVASESACTTLLANATPMRGSKPKDTLQALVNLARNPAPSATAVQALFDLSQAPPAPYQPTRPANVPPAAWTLALRFVGDGISMDGPGNFAVAADGSLWVPNNYVYSPDGDAVVCGSKQLLHFTPTGQYVPGSPYTGGGVDGAGFGVTIDPAGYVWVGNFGFGSPGCTEKSPANSVSQFHQNGTPVSPDTGWTDGMVSWPQGMTSDREGNIWIANCANGVVTKYPGGDHAAAVAYVADPDVCGTTSECARPFDVAVNKKGQAFVTLNDRDAVAVLHPDGTPTKHSPLEGPFDQPMGIASDSRGNMWVASSASLRVPCPNGFLTPRSTDGSIALIDKNGRTVKGPFVGGGLTIPWGLTVDGDDNVWIANFYLQRLSHFCGRKPKKCPPGAKTGSPISPDSGYAFDGLVRNTGVAVDPSGNVWLANNWKNEPNPVGNPGGYQIVAFIGIAPPVAAPTIGPPRKP
jgi:sugar lactone lactonase YvrE